MPSFRRRLTCPGANRLFAHLDPQRLDDTLSVELTPEFRQAAAERLSRVGDYGDLRHRAASPDARTTTTSAASAATPTTTPPNTSSG